MNVIGEMGIRPDRSCSRKAFAAAVVVFAVLAGCGPGSAPAGFGEGGHFDILIGSSEPGGGALAVEYDFDREVPVFLSQCFPAAEPPCEGGIALYGSEDPGFEPLEEDEPEESLFVLAEGTIVSVEVTAKDEGASLFLNGVSLAQVGDAVELGEAVEDLHRHGEWQLALPGGTPPAGPFSLSLKLTTTSAAYDESEPFTLLLVPMPGDEG